MSDKKNFIRVCEDFTCIVCGFHVVGNGYTNHCPMCLYSMHVDKDVPGDRLSKCFGIMRPIGIEMKNGNYIIVQKCEKCNKIKKNKASEKDNLDEICKISNKLNF